MKKKSNRKYNWFQLIDTFSEKDKRTESPVDGKSSS